MSKLPRDSVEREILIRGPVERVFAALTDPSLYPTWGPERVEGKLAPGERPILDFGPAGGGKVAIFVVALEPPRYFAYRWMQGVTDPKVLLGDPLQGHNTLVEFHVEGVAGGTRVRVVESGLSALPGIPGLDPDAAIEQMGQGWQLMLGGLERSFSLVNSGPSDRIENKVTLSAPAEKVYDALIHPERWWAEKVEGALTPGALAILDHGQFGRYRVYVEGARAPSYFAFRKVLGVEDPARWLDDPRAGPNTLVEFHVEPEGQKTRLTQSESGFLSLATDAAAAHYRRAGQGWGIVLDMLQMHLAKR